MNNLVDKIDRGFPHRYDYWSLLELGDIPEIIDWHYYTPYVETVFTIREFYRWGIGKWM